MAATAGPAPATVAGRRLPATVPGCVSTDLLAAGLLPDPYVGANEGRHSWVGRTNWRYETSFDTAVPAPGERVDLVFEGLDTVATIKLNDRVIGTVANMHRSYRFDLRALLREGANLLVVDFEAPVDAAERLSQELGPRPHTNGHPFNAIRKMACNFGWDWGPELVMAGIWRPAYLERWRVARLASVRPLVQVDLPEGAAVGAGEPRWADASSPTKGHVTVEFHVDIEWAEHDANNDANDGANDEANDGADLPVRAEVAGQVAVAPVRAGENKAVVRLEIPEADLWWPAGYGTQPLYEAKVALELPNGEALDRCTRRLGFRTVALDTAPDERGSRLGFVVNGRAVQVRGANWIPDDCFPSRLDRTRYQKRVEDARGSNCNLLRVWGGGIYESEDFYDAADEVGLLVWQDFCLACAAYAEEDPLRAEIEAEAREAVTRLSAHPSLAVWSGCNENIWGYEDWGWKEPLGGKTWGAGYYFDIFPSTVAELDPTRPYMAGSPWSFGHEAHPNDPRFGSVHVWDVWNQKDYSAYRDWRPQFVAEFGFQGPPAWSTLVRALGDAHLSKDDPVLEVHEKATDGVAKLDRWLALHFPQPEAFDDWHWATSLIQARAVTLAVEHWRSLSPRCRGTIVWQLNDCWPVLSWAAVDGDGRKKPLWYALREAYRDKLLTVQPGGSEGELVAVAVNDSAEPWSLDLYVARQSFGGGLLAKSTASVKAAPGQSVAVLLDPEVALAGDPSGEVLVVAAENDRALWFYEEDKDLALPAPALTARAERAPGGWDVVVEAATLQRDVALLADRAHPDASADNMLFTLLPGESRRVHVSCPTALDPDRLMSPDVLRSANQLVRPG